MQEITTDRKLFVHAYSNLKKLHVLIAVHENIPQTLSCAEIKQRFGIGDRHTAYIKEPSGERVYVQRHQEWKGHK
jgi:hypothetical protein